jgi:hypothetical protein
VEANGESGFLLFHVCPGHDAVVSLDSMLFKHGVSLVCLSASIRQQHLAHAVVGVPASYSQPASDRRQGLELL